MEPSTAEDGDHCRLSDLFAGQTASMEPSSAEDGDPRLWNHWCLAFRLQWSRPQLRTETNTITKIQPAMLMLQWSRPQLRTETCDWRSADHYEGTASMEPSSAEDGDIPCLRGHIGGVDSFNGAVLS